MFKKKENGFSLVELSVAAAVAVGLAVVAVSVVNGTAASVSAKGSSAAAAESCTINEALQSGGDSIETCSTGGTDETGTGEPEAPAGFTASFNATNNVGTFNLNGVSYELYNEAGTGWKIDDIDNWNGGQLFTLKVNPSLNNGHLGTDGFYYVNDSQKNTSVWGTPEGNPQVQEDGSVFYFDAANNFRGAVMYFTSDPFNGGTPAAIPAPITPTNIASTLIAPQALWSTDAPWEWWAVSGSPWSLSFRALSLDTANAMVAAFNDKKVYVTTSTGQSWQIKGINYGPSLVWYGGYELQFAVSGDSNGSDLYLTKSQAKPSFTFSATPN
jgi:type II secretory pathway pseudopilin PulG